MTMQNQSPHIRPLLYAFCGIIAGASIASITWGVLHLREEHGDDSQEHDRILRAASHYPNRAAPGCPEGQLRDASTDGRCCWLGQAYNHALSRCVGTPVACPTGLARDPVREACVDPELLATKQGCQLGQVVTRNTQGHCCWVGQWWSNDLDRCVGEPHDCPDGMDPGDEMCVPQRERMTRAQIWFELRKMRPEVDLCDEVVNPERFDGVLWARFQVTPAGGITEFEFTRVSQEDAAANPELAACARRTLERQILPASKFSTQIYAFPMVFNHYETPITSTSALK